MFLSGVSLGMCLVSPQKPRSPTKTALLVLFGTYQLFETPTSFFIAQGSLRLYVLVFIDVYSNVQVK